ncbi:hypothetical protein CR513_39564, partial [Mucuna pruriens]
MLDVVYSYICRPFEVASLGGGEHTSNEFEEFCVKNGIQHEVLTLYTLQNNDLAKRRNQIVFNMARSMLKEKALPHYFQVKQIAIYVLNKCPNQKTKGVNVEGESCSTRVRYDLDRWLKQNLGTRRRKVETSFSYLLVHCLIYYTSNQV